MSFESQPTSESLSEQKETVSEERELLIQIASQDMARVTLIRVMNLDNHAGVTFSDNDGGFKYSPDNQQYPNQGDFAFSGDNAFDAAVTRGYPNHLGNIHIMNAHKDDVVEPYPDDMPGVVYVKNGAEVIAKKIPREIVDENIDRVNSGKDPLKTSDVVDRM